MDDVEIFDEGIADHRKAQVGKAELLRVDIGYLRIRNLDVLGAQSGVQSHLRSLGRIRGLVLDVRDTDGEDLNAGLAAAALFRKEGRILHYAHETRRGLLRSSIDLDDAGFAWSGERGGEEYKTVTWGRLPYSCEGVNIIMLTGGDIGMATEAFTHVVAQDPTVTIFGSPTSGRGVPARFFRVLRGRVLRMVDSQIWHSQTTRWEKLQACVPGVNPHGLVGDRIDPESNLIDLARKGLEDLFRRQAVSAA